MGIEARGEGRRHVRPAFSGRPHDRLRQHRRRPGRAGGEVPHIRRVPGGSQEGGLNEGTVSDPSGGAPSAKVEDLREKARDRDLSLVKKSKVRSPLTQDLEVAAPLTSPLAAGVVWIVTQRSRRLGSRAQDFRLIV